MRANFKVVFGFIEPGPSLLCDCESGGSADLNNKYERSKRKRGATESLEECYRSALLALPLCDSSVNDAQPLPGGPPFGGAR